MRPFKRHPHRRTTAPISTLWLLMLLLSLGSGCGRFSTPREYDFRGEVRLAISHDVAGYAVVGGERYGFASDVTDTIARSLGCRLRVTPNLTTDSIRRGLQSGEFDIAVVPRSERVALHDFPSESFYTTNYVLLQPSWVADAAGESAREAWSGKRVLTDRMFRTGGAFAALQQAGAKCDTSRLDGITMAKRLMGGKAEAMICERSEAELIKFLHRSLREVATIEEPCEIIFIFANRAAKLAFTSSLHDFADTETYATLVDLYFGETSIAERFTQLKYRPTRVVDGISVWDSQLQKIASQVGVDWRLMSAMAYHESRFRNDQVSHRGAVGLMQVMPIVAEDFKLEEGYDLADPSTNINLAARLLRRSSRALGFGDFPTNDDQIAILVASYNCGITRILEAQRLVVAAGGDGGSWEAIAAMLTNMSDAEWCATSDYKMRRFGDAPVTIAYTNGVMELYDIYRGAIKN